MCALPTIRLEGGADIPVFETPSKQASKQASKQKRKTYAQ